MPKYEVHPAAELFPMLEGEALDSFVEDVRANGLQQAIVLCDEKVLDGRNRLVACERAGVKPRFETWDGDDPIAHVLSLNLHRRHLNESQRAMVADRVAEAYKEKAKKRQLATLKRGDEKPVVANLPPRAEGKSREKAAALLNVSPRSVQNARRSAPRTWRSSRP